VDDLNPIVIGKVINPRTGLEEDDIVFRGFYITNSEVGKSSLKIAGGGTETTQPGERSCPAGYVVLDKPNQYGAFCEPKEGLPKTTPEACKFGMIGTPPDCHCPEHMEFAGYKGRVWVNQPKKGYCTDFTSADVQRLKSESSRIIAGSNTEARIAALKAPADLTAAADSSRRRALKDRRHGR
jgi:hypothetical protein